MKSCDILSIIGSFATIKIILLTFIFYHYIVFTISQNTYEFIELYVGEFTYLTPEWIIIFVVFVLYFPIVWRNGG